MTSGFDPYGQWLGISPHERPVDYYRLLGLPPFESDAELIAAAAAERIQIARSHAAGPEAEAAKRLYREVVTARQCLLDAGSRAAYDARLLAADVPASQQTVPGGAPLAPPPAIHPTVPPTIKTATATNAPPQANAPQGANAPPNGPEIAPPNGPAPALPRARRAAPMAPPALGLHSPPPAPPPPPPAPPPPVASAPEASAEPWAGIDDLAAEPFVHKKSVAGKHKRGAEKRTAGKKARVGNSAGPAGRRPVIIGGVVAMLVLTVVVGSIAYFKHGQTPAVASLKKAAEKSTETPAERPAASAAAPSDAKSASSTPEHAAKAEGETGAEDATPTAESTNTDAAKEPTDTATVATAPAAASPDGANPGAALLELAQTDGAVEPIQKAIEAGIDIETRDAAGRSLLRRAVMGGHQELASYLISKEADVNSADVLGETPLMSAAQRGDAKLVSLLLNSNAKPDARTVANDETRSGGLAAMHVAARAGNEEVVNVLLEGKADPNVATAAGVTPLMIACWRQNVSIVQALLLKQANAGAADADKQTVLMYAVEGGDEDIVKQIVACDAVKVKAKSKTALTALSIALARKSEDLVQILRDAAKNEAVPLDF